MDAESRLRQICDQCSGPFVRVAAADVVAVSSGPLSPDHALLISSCWGQTHVTVARTRIESLLSAVQSPPTAADAATDCEETHGDDSLSDDLD